MRFKTVPIFFLVAGAILFGCNRAFSLNVSPVNDLVPQKYKQQLVFEPRDAKYGPIKFMLPVPKGWEKEAVLGEGSGMGSYTDGTSSISVRSSCDHKQLCMPANWNQQIDKDLAWQNDIARTNPSGWKENRSDSDVMKIERNVWIDGRRIVRIRDLFGEDPRISVKVFWWSVGGSEFYSCVAQLNSGLQDAADAFEKACQLAINY